MAEKTAVSELIRGTQNLSLETQTNDDKPFLGLKGLARNSTLYRVCREDEDLKSDILSKARDKKSEKIKTVNQHLNSGSKNASRYISATTDLAVAEDWAVYAKEDAKKGKKPEKRETPKRIIAIDLSKIPREQEDTLINLTNKEVFGHFVSGATQINRAKSSKEVIFQWKIPKEMISELTDPKPPPPK